MKSVRLRKSLLKTLKFSVSIFCFTPMFVFAQDPCGDGVSNKMSPDFTKMRERFNSPDTVLVRQQDLLSRDGKLPWNPRSNAEIYNTESKFGPVGKTDAFRCSPGLNCQVLTKGEFGDLVAGNKSKLSYGRDANPADIYVHKLTDQSRKSLYPVLDTGTWAQNDDGKIVYVFPTDDSDGLQVTTLENEQLEYTKSKGVATRPQRWKGEIETKRDPLSRAPAIQPHKPWMVEKWLDKTSQRLGSTFQGAGQFLNGIRGRSAVVAATAGGTAFEIVTGGVTYSQATYAAGQIGARVPQVAVIAAGAVAISSLPAGISRAIDPNSAPYQRKSNSYLENATMLYSGTPIGWIFGL